MPATHEPIDLLQSFVNTVDIEGGTDELSTGAGLAAWCHDHGLTSAPDAASAADLDLAVRLRAALRLLLSGHACDGFDAVAAELPLRVCVTDEGPACVPIEVGVRGALAEVVAALASVSGDGTLARLKLCAADDCGWAFYDTSKNRSRRWCSMEVCGNRAKTRAYRRSHTVRD